MAQKPVRWRTLMRTVSLNWKPIVFWTLALGFIFFNWDWFVANRQSILTVLSFAGQLLFAMMFLIVQFVALFWFLARPRLYWIDPGETGISFADYKGNSEVLEVADRVVTLLRGAKKFKRMGGEVTRGVLLVGPPGTGKSYLAQAVATEAGVPFAFASAPSFMNMFMGISNLIIMNLYRKARKKAMKYGACIIFIDEIDAIGMRRQGVMGAGAPSYRGGGFGGHGADGGGFGGPGSGSGGGWFGRWLGGGAAMDPAAPDSGYRGIMMGGMGMGSAMLNELLLQMDPPNIERGLINKLLRKLGLRTRRAEQPVVLTMAATNVPDILDPALLRPGRFDRKITVDLPDFDGRKEVTDYYLSKVKHDPQISLDRVASDTIYYTPVAIKHVINEAVIQAHFDGRDMITYDDICRAREVHEWGLRQPIRSMSKEEKRRIAYHEAGHAVAAYLLLPKHERPVKATIIRHGRALGLVAWKPLEERHTTTREEILAHIQISLASRAAERLFLGTEMNGVYSDLMQATQAAAAYMGLYGMGGSLFSYAAIGGPQAADASLKQRVDKLLDEQYQRVQRLLEEHSDAVVGIAEALLAKEELDRDEITSIIESARSSPLQAAAAFQPTRWH